MGRVAILADDLSGALDTAAPFARPGHPVTVAWRREGLDGLDAFALDTETRESDAAVAAASVIACLPRLEKAGISFKKLDSQMRGNTLAELAACAASEAFASVVIAPAFPEQGRFTRRGRQVVPASAAEIDIAGALSRQRIPVSVVGRGEKPPDRGVAVCDAETGADLARLVAGASDLAAPVLWCGTAGLARAFGRPVTVSPADLAGCRLLVVATRNPVATAQAAKLARRLGDLAFVVRAPGETARTVDAAGEALRRGESCALLFALPSLEPAAAATVFSDAFARLAGGPPPDVLVAVGGDTVFRLCRASGATSLTAIGEWSAGVPVSRIDGGAWSGKTLISKSGAFGNADVLVHLLDNIREEVRP